MSNLLGIISLKWMNKWVFPNLSDKIKEVKLPNFKKKMWSNGFSNVASFSKLDQYSPLSFYQKD